MSWCVVVTGFVSDNVGNGVMVCGVTTFVSDNVGNGVMVRGGDMFCL